MEDNGAEVLLAERRHAVQRARGPELRRSRGTYVTRLILRYISAITSIAIIGVLADAIRSYKKTQHVTNPYRDGHGRFPVWPEGLKLRPTWMLLGVAVVAAITSTLLCIASFSSAVSPITIPIVARMQMDLELTTGQVRRMTKAGNIFTVIISTISLTLWIAVTGYYAAWDTKKTNFDLLSWTCKHSDPEYNYNNIDFNETCMEMVSTAVALEESPLDSTNTFIEVREVGCCRTRSS